MLEILKYRKDMVIRNREQLSRGIGARYLQVTRGRNGVLVAVQWRSKAKAYRIGHLLIDFDVAEEMKALPAPTLTTDRPWRPGRNRSTLYEIVATDGERAILLGYWGPGRSSRRVVEALLKFGDRLKRITGADEAEVAGKWGRGDYRVKMGDWEIRYSGRTEREARALAYPFIASENQGPQ